MARRDDLTIHLYGEINILIEFLNNTFARE